MDELQKFLDERFPKGIQMFNTRNIVGDNMVPLYRNVEAGIKVDYCPEWEYIEIFGLTDKQFQVLDEYMNGKRLKSFLKSIDT